jgi:hypothetical protein
MATWMDMARENATAANRLVRDDLHRPGVSRAYFAAYCHVTAALTMSGHAQMSARGNPAHQKLPEMVENNLHSLPRPRRRKLANAVRELYKRRIVADYLPSSSCDGTLAHQTLRTMNTVWTLLGGAS